MKQFFKDWLLPPKVIDFLQTKHSLYNTKKLDLSILEKNKELKDKYKGKRCFVLGNAPSINNIDITLLKDEYVFVTNSFYNHPDFKTLKPIFHSCVKVPFNTEGKTKVLSAMSNNVLKDSDIFLNLADKYIVDNNQLFLQNNVYYIATANIDREYRLDKITRDNRTNMLQVLEIAIYLGFSEIYLHGIDLDEACKGQYHYGFLNKLVVKDITNENGISTRTQSDVFYNASLTYKEFETIQSTAFKKQIIINNLNEKSMLKMFPTVSLKDII